MSKYYKTKDVYEAVGRAFVKDELADREVTLVTDELAELPTIEVSEEVIENASNFKVSTIADENAEMGMRTEIVPCIEVSEDAISRNRVLKYIADIQLAISDERKPTVDGRTVCDWIFDEVKEFLSVVPKELQSYKEWVDLEDSEIIAECVHRYGGKAVVDACRERIGAEE